MVFCSKCGEENNDSAVYCQKCGNKLKPEEKEEDFSLIDIKAIIKGIIAFVCSLILITIPLFEVYSNSLGVSLFIYGFSLFIIQLSHFIGGLFAGLNSKRKYLSGMLNGAIIGIIIGIPMSLIMINLSPMSRYILIELWLRFCIAGLIGGLVGVFINRTIHKS